MAELTEAIVEQLSTDKIRALNDEALSALAAAKAAAKPFEEKARSARSELQKLGCLIRDNFATELRTLATYGKSSRQGIHSVTFYEVLDKSIRVSYYIGSHHNSCGLNELLDKGDYASLLEKRDEEQIAAARRAVEQLAAESARAQEKLAKLKAKRDK